VEEKEFVDKIISLEDRRYDLWKYYQGRADAIRERLWAAGTWLAGIIMVILALPFTAKFVELSQGNIPLTVKFPILTLGIAIFGLMFCFYSYFVIIDLQEHIERNWSRADYIKKNEFIQLRFTKTGKNVLFLIIALQAIAFLYLGAISLFYR
jgi:hypothetical protein